MLENQIDILALNETFLKPKFKFHLPGYDIYKNNRLVGTKGGIAILVKKGIIVNQEWKNEHFNVITDNEALAVEIELQNGVILATIYCPNGNPSLRLFRMINALSNQVIFLGDFNSKHKQFGCVKPNKSGQTLVNIADDLKLFYVNQLDPNRSRHTRNDPFHGTSDSLDMAFLSPGLSSRNISFSVADDHMGSDHFPIQISLDKPLKRNTPLTEPCCRHLM